MKISEMIRKNLHDRLGIDNHEPGFKDVNKIKKELSETYRKKGEIEKHAADRRYMGSIRYGGSNSKSSLQHEKLIKSMQAKLEHYKKTGNGEMLVDLYNYCIIEFSQETHRNYHFKTLDDEVH